MIPAVDNSESNILTVNEIFYSIQGESSHAGRPCVFIRLTYCNLRCNYCDTAYAFNEGGEMKIDEIINKVISFRCKLVEITGGEPLLQTNVHHLIKRLCDSGYEVLLETSGSIDIVGVDSRVRRIIDFKCPGSGMEKKNYWGNVLSLIKNDEVKFVISDRIDYEWSKSKIAEHNICKMCPVIFSPVYDRMSPRDLAEWILQDKLDVRFQIQMHKYIWDPGTRGV
jgi:7-carboxy-7-deazaguanine synthase